MATLKLPVLGAPLPANFSGTRGELYEAMRSRMRVTFPQGQTPFVIQDEEPQTNLGPWLKGGTKWYVWDTDTKTYVPLNISESDTTYQISATAPATGERQLWLQFKGTRAIQWHRWVGADAENGEWVPIGITLGPTADRPAAPVQYERYFDTDIGAEIYFDDFWRTVDGCPGDVKFVTSEVLDEALAKNPGWREIGQYLSDSDARGRLYVAASFSASDSATEFPESGSELLDEPTPREQGEKWGEETTDLTANQLPEHIHEAWDEAVILDDGSGTWEGFGSASSVVWVPGYGATPQLPFNSTGGGDPHNNIQRCVALWCLVKL